MKKSISKGNRTKDKEDDHEWPVPEGYIHVKSRRPNLKKLIEISKFALKLGYITINDLACILALDNIYKKNIFLHIGINYK